MTNDEGKLDHSVASEASLANVMRLAGERAEIPLSIESRVYHQVKQDWQSTTAKPIGDKVYETVRKSWRKQTILATVRRWLMPAGLAAAAVAAVFVMTLVSQPQPIPARPVATVSRVIGSGPVADQYNEGMAVHTGHEILTGPGEGVSLLLARSESFRIDENTHLRVDAADRFTLLKGRIYADTGQFVYRDGGLKIDTPFGAVTDVGTQFSVTSSDGVLDVAVREGRVDVQHETGLSVARIGERLTLVLGEGVSVEPLSTYDASWDWVVDLTPEFDTSNKSLLEFLKWAARETGRELEFDSDATRMFAMRTDVHGSFDGMTPDAALAAILATTTVRYRIEAGKIAIEN